MRKDQRKRWLKRKKTNVKTNPERIKKEKEPIKSEDKFNNIYLYSYI